MHPSFFFLFFSFQTLAAIDSSDSESFEFDPSCILVLIKESYFISEEEVKSYFSQITPNAIESVEDQVLIKENRNVDILDKTEVRQQLLKLRLTFEAQGRIDDILKQINKHPMVEHADKNYIGHLSVPSSVVTPNDTQYISEQEALRKVQLNRAWGITRGSSSVLVGVLDSGIDTSHPDLVNKVNVTLSRNFTDEGTINDLTGHGTHIAGIIAATSNNAEGIAGSAWDVKLVNLKVSDRNGDLDVFDVVAAINYAQDIGIKIINCSFGFPLVAAVFLQSAVSSYSGLIVAAAGNNGNTVQRFPAAFNYDKIISVASCTTEDEIASNSSHGSWVDLAAPGVGIYSTLPNNQYGKMSGTSMAAPFVTGTAALLLSLHPYFSPTDIKGYIFAALIIFPVSARIRRLAEG